MPAPLLAPADDRLIVALDVPNALTGLSMAESLRESVSFYKIGLGMLTGGGLALATAGAARDRGLGASGVCPCSRARTTLHADRAIHRHRNGAATRSVYSSG